MKRPKRSAVGWGWWMAECMWMQDQVHSKPVHRDRNMLLLHIHVSVYEAVMIQSWGSMPPTYPNPITSWRPHFTHYQWTKLSPLTYQPLILIISHQHKILASQSQAFGEHTNYYPNYNTMVLWGHLWMKLPFFKFNFIFYFVHIGWQGCIPIKTTD